MGAGVGDGVGDVTVRQVEVAAAVREAELQDAHAGHAEVLAQLVDLRRDEAEVFGDERQIAEDLPQALKSACPGALTHWPLMAVSSSAAIDQ